MAQSAEGRVLLAKLTAQFNEKLSLAIYNLYPDGGGHDIALLAADDWIGRDVIQPALYGFVNVTEPACAASVASTPNCTTQTLNAASGATATTWLWAEGTYLSAGAHAQLGLQAETRVRGNPL